ncbi:MAG: PPOX class F420-dependent oxidoreductase [Dehalococcoidia bacterium]|nr:PPOX class F420-dependent oxidoreductase [Dehalococcoidia bacterium]
MAAKLSEKAVELLKKPVLAHLATIMKNGTPQVTPLWIDTDGTNLFINTEQNRLKAKNMRRNPNVALSVVDPQNNYNTLWIQGTVIDMDAKNGQTHADTFAKKYRGLDKYVNTDSADVRVKITIRPDKVAGSASK